MSPRNEWATHRMTIRIYRVAADTGDRLPVRTLSVVEQEPWLPPPEIGNPCAYPPCACPRHRRPGHDSPRIGP
ncbi:hypothetical protein [Streptomyces boncukensis]|uniref:Uncharacterized protein n=1 Tax=Streptomyces boncukensis TaxID=2711219 RepID=A0A6G4WZ18_9ACTN|nr:hypothetical protein [Streptomyces boncukensis]NGO69764.1 hypothetical protein [Streptomyces boncukensis]